MWEVVTLLKLRLDRGKMKLTQVHEFHLMSQTPRKLCVRSRKQRQRGRVYPGGRSFEQSAS